MYYYGYIITNNINVKLYAGITKNLHERWLQHKSIARNLTKNVHSYLYNAMRKHGVENFTFKQVAQFDSREECCDWEINKIAKWRNSGVPNYNIADGGKIGMDMRTSPRYEEWKENLTTNAVAFSYHREIWLEKLRKARKGRKPALGMSHTPENKALASKVSNEYWNTQETYARNPELLKQIFKLSHKEAKEKFGISTTHYYRLKKRFVTNDNK